MKNIHIHSIPDKLKIILRENEKIIYATRPSFSAFIVSIFMAFFINMLFALVLLFFNPYTTAIAIIPLLISLVAGYLSWKNRYYLITDTRTIVSEGVFNIAIKIILNKHVRLISINTGIIDRYLKAQHY